MINHIDAKLTELLIMIVISQDKSCFGSLRKEEQSESEMMNCYAF